MIHNPLHPVELVKETLIEGAGLSVTDAAYNWALIEQHYYD